MSIWCRLGRHVWRYGMITYDPVYMGILTGSRTCQRCERTEYQWAPKR